MQTRAGVKPKALKVVPIVQLDAHSLSQKRIGQSKLIRQIFEGTKKKKDIMGTCLNW
jgi:hypothetical protein